MGKYPLKKYPVVGACCLDCGLCPRYYTEGSSRCPGCCGPGFEQKHPSCGFIICCVKQKSLETCAECSDWRDCERVAGILGSTRHQDSFISYQPVVANFAFIEKNGIREFVRRENEKQEILRYLLANYDEGRSKSFYCTGCQVLPPDRLREAVSGIETGIAGGSGIKEKAKAIRTAIIHLADTLKIDLGLRK
ncbi:MAG: DUF3795 domain-containing protein [Dehalococcoidales bacterium]|nr:DUF3795 domain-containing protein [Dehalococcoidales bacterium]